MMKKNENNPLEGIEFVDALEATKIQLDPPSEIEPPDAGAKPQEAIMSRNLELEDRLDNFEIKGLVIHAGSEYSNSISQLSPQDRSATYKEAKVDEWDIFYERANSVFTELKTKHYVSGDSIRSIVCSFLDIFSVDRNILLTLSQLPNSRVYNPAEHAMKVSILSLCIGTAMGYDKNQLIELGMCAFASALGMVFMDDIYLSTKPLSEEQQLRLRSHPMVGANIVDSTRGMPMVASLVVYQIHERENGLGYPKQRKGRFIHQYAKIIAVADVFQALCSPRAHRPSFKPFEAMTRVLSMVKIGHLAVEVVKPFMRYTSLYPVGSLVRLADQKIARVIAANQEQVKSPVVSVIYDSHDILLKDEEIYQIDLSQEFKYQIVATLKESDVNADKLKGL